MKANLSDEGLDTRDLTFVYGDTHKGGWGDYTSGTSTIRIYNTGGWVVHNAKHHPSCQLFAVDQGGEEYLLDVSFRDVNLDGDGLLAIAARDYENRKRSTGRTVRFFAKQFLS